MKLDNPLLVRWEYASEERLAKRNSIFRALIEGDNPEDVAFDAVAESPPKRLLDVGCGPGDFADRLRTELRLRVVAADLSPEMVRRTRSRGVEAIVARLKEHARPVETREQVARIARFTAKAIGLERDLRDDEIILDDRYHAGTYGIPDASTLDAMRLVARLEAMITDPVYEGKSMAGLIDLASRGEIDRSSTVLYAHLGGQPALNAYSALF